MSTRNRLAGDILPLVVITMLVVTWFANGIAGHVAAYSVLMLLPGMGLYLLVERRPTLAEILLAALALSPVITSGLAVIFMAGGAAPQIAANWSLVFASAVGVAGALRFRITADRVFRLEFTGRQWALLSALVLATLVLVAYLPMTSEWWRFRSDAWFHRAVVAQVTDFGVPPEDPYFAGYTLQYMWFYHVLIVMLSQVSALDPFRLMTLLNVQSLCGVFLATFLFAGVFVTGFAKRVGSCMTVVFGLNGLFWLFLPLRLASALLGETRGPEEVARRFSLSPFDLTQAASFLKIYHSQDFLLDKFVVATAFGIALCCLGVFWYGTAEYLRSRQRFPLFAAGVALIGMLGFHTLFGIVMLVTAFGGLGLSFIFRRRVDNYHIRAPLELAIVLVAAFAVASPYLYSITHLKEDENVLPVAFSLPQIIGIIVTCASAAVLAAFQRRFFMGRGLTQRYLQYAILTAFVFCSLIKLADGGSADKMPLFVFFPLAVIGGWSLPDFIAHQGSATRRFAAVVTVAVLFFVPVNAISFLAYFNTPTHAMYTTDEAAMGVWVRENTPRDAVFIDRNDEVFMLVAGPRRYYCGRRTYASQWGYDKLEISGRMHARSALYSDASLDVTTLRLLGTAPWELYVIDRRDRRNAPSALELNPLLFEKLFTAGKIDLYRVNAAACADAARARRIDGHSEVPDEVLLRESGL